MKLIERLKVDSNIWKLPSLQLRLPENTMSIREAMLDPPFFLDMIQIDESTGICILWIFSSEREILLVLPKKTQLVG